MYALYSGYCRWLSTVTFQSGTVHLFALDATKLRISFPLAVSLTDFSILCGIML